MAEFVTVSAVRKRRVETPRLSPAVLDIIHAERQRLSAAFGFELTVAQVVEHALHVLRLSARPPVESVKRAAESVKRDILRELAPHVRENFEGYLSAGKKILAIKIVKEHDPGMSLKEAKDFVEQVMAQVPAYREAYTKRLVEP